MAASLASGVDQLADVKREQKEYEKEFDRKHAEFLAQPCTPEMEQKYTRLIKQRRLRDGDCQLSWKQYFKYRDQHPECKPLTSDNIGYAENFLGYVGMWTACAVRPETTSAELTGEETSRAIAA
jgi:hypothetical protein